MNELPLAPQHHDRLSFSNEALLVLRIIGVYAFALNM